MSVCFILLWALGQLISLLRKIRESSYRSLQRNKASSLDRFEICKRSQEYIILKYFLISRINLDSSSPFL